MSRLKIIAAVWIAGCCLSLYAQPQNFPLIHYTTEDGLSHDEVNFILKDREGFMWFATSGGLNRFDGKNFRVFRHAPGDSASLCHNHVIGLFQDQLGYLWVGTSNGLCRLDTYTFRFEFFPATAGNPVSAIVPDGKGNGWFTLWDKLVKINLETLEFEFFPFPDELGGNGNVNIDSRGRIWLYAAGNIFLFDKERKTFQFHMGRRSTDPGFAFPVGTLIEDENGKLWLPSWGNGLYYFDEQQGRFVDYPDEGRISTQLLQDRDGFDRQFFWVGGGVHGLYLYYPEENIAFEMRPDPREPYSHNGRMARYFFRDDETGIVWIATEDGIEKYDPYAVRFRRGLLPLAQDFSQFSLVADAIQDRTDAEGETFWLAVWGNGLFRWERRKNGFRKFHHENGLTNNTVFCLEQDRSGRIWIGNFKGIDILDPRTLKSERLDGFFTKPNFNHNVISLLIDSRNCAWIGTNFEGLFRYDIPSKKLTRVPVDSPEQQQTGIFITNIAEDSSGYIWASSFSGFYRIDPATGDSRSFRGAEGLSDHLVCDDILVGKDGRIWIASRNGLIHADSSGKVIKIYKESDGLLDLHVYRIAQDHTGFIWAATNNHLHRLDPSTGHVSYFGKNDGLFANIAPSGMAIARNGEIFVGYQNVFNYFDPTRLRFNHRPPKIVLTGVQVANRETPFRQGDPIILHPDENVVTFEFAALNYSQPENNRYAYKLEGFDRDWTYTNLQRATYTNLDGGKYTFRVRAANNDGVWNMNELTATLRVIPPFYKTWYYWALLALLAFALAFAILWHRYRQRVKVEAIRRHIARDLHDDMGSSLSSIRFFSQFAKTKLQSDPSEAEPILERIGESAAVLSESMQDIIWTIDSGKDRLDDLATRMREFGFKVLEARNIRFTVQVSESFRPAKLSLAQRRNIYLIFKEAVNNALKYSECNEVKLFLTIVRNRLRMSIEDDGKGFDEEKVRHGHGLQNMKRRAEEVGGNLLLHSEEGKGTKILLTMRLR
jgi:signal transduction histidine kinase/ligand-binding sensor domain-containing protein